MTDWDRLLEETLASLPPAVRSRITEVQFRVARVPTAEQREQMDCDECGLLGLYEGVPLPERFEGNEPLMPDRVTLFTMAHEEEFGDGDDMAEEVRETIVHEIGHFLGLDDDELAELGL